MISVKLLYNPCKYLRALSLFLSSIETENWVVKYKCKIGAVGISFYTYDDDMLN